MKSKLINSITTNIHHFFYRLAERLLEKETIALPDIVEVLGPRPYPQKKELMDYLEELKERAIEEEEKAAQAAEQAESEDKAEGDAKKEDDGEKTENEADKEDKSDSAETPSDKSQK